MTRIPYEALSKRDQERLGGFDPTKAEIAKAKWLGEIDSDDCHPAEKMPDFHDHRLFEDMDPFSKR